jgi:adenosylcobyric acid synthase
MSACPLFVGGTSSNAGKSWMVTAICAWLRRRGVRVAPFKAQNMSNNSYPCWDGGEIGRAQVAQAEACGIEPERAMNPILLKPNGNGTSQVVLHGRLWKTLAARDYYALSPQLRVEVLSAYHELAKRFDVIVIEGAGSVSELNLREHDVVNLWLATALRAPWMLVADIERGGVFGSIVGSVALLADEERALFRGFAINKFRGDLSLFDDGVSVLEEKTDAPCLGVFPFAPDVFIDAEDSLAAPTLANESTPPPDGARIAIVRLPCLSNSTDFRLLTWADWLTSPPPPDREYDFIILPGSKNTIGDLQWLRSVGLADWMLRQHHAGTTIIGICGGFQMLGRAVSDPLGVESTTTTTRVQGLGLLPVETVLSAEKTTRVVTATTTGGVSFGAYEIHLGKTTYEGQRPTPFARLDDGATDGARAAGVVGTYLHGALEHAAVCSELFGIEMPSAPPKERHYQRLADWFDRHQRGFDRLLTPSTDEVSTVRIDAMGGANSVS